MESQSFLSLIFSLFVLSTLSFVFCDSQRCNFPAIFNFGDSNSDTGGFSAAFGQAGPPHGESFFRAPAGRYCDGRLLVDFMAEGFKVPYLSAFLDSIGSNFSHGANFATAGSTIKPVDCNLKCGFSPFSLQKQFYQFNDFHNRSLRLRKLGGFYEQTLPSADYFSRALYTFDIGQNDLTSSLFANMTIDEVQADVPDLVHQFKSIVKYVYGRGGKHFWIHNTGPIGCLAYVLERLPVKTSDVDSHGCSKTLNQLSQTFNKALKKAVIQLRDELPKAAITYVDLFSVKYSLFTDAQKHDLLQDLLDL